MSNDEKELQLDPLSEQAKEKIKLITLILKDQNSSIEKQVKRFDELYEKSLEDLKIYYNVYK